MSEKICSRCERTLPTWQFARDASKKDGFQSHCRDCRSAYNRKWWDGVPNQVVFNWRDRWNSKRRCEADARDADRLDSLSSDMFALGLARFLGAKTDEEVENFVAWGNAPLLFEPERFSVEEAWERAALSELRRRLGFVWKTEGSKTALRHDPERAESLGRYNDWTTPQRQRHLEAAREKYAEQLEGLRSAALT